MLTNKDTYQEWPATPNYGIQVGINTSSDYVDVFRVDNTGASIAGWKFTDTSLSTVTGSKAIALGVSEQGTWDTYGKSLLLYHQVEQFIHHNFI